MTDKYDFGNLSPIEFEAMCVDLLSAETGLRFERFSEGADGGIDGRHSSTSSNIILQAKHFKDSTWSGLKSAAKRESAKVNALDPTQYFFLTSQPLTPRRKTELKKLLDHKSVNTSNIWGRTELNDRLLEHSAVEKRHIKLWLSSATVLERVLRNNVMVFTEGTHDEIERILKVFVANPSLGKAADILNDRHSLIVSGPPGVGKTTLAQVLAAEYCEEGWELVSINKMEDALAAFQQERKQVFVFDDFLGKIKLDHRSFAKDEGRITRFFEMVAKRDNKRFILTTRSYVLQAAKDVSEELDEAHIDLSELVLDLKVYTREVKARILYNHLYHSDISEEAINALISGNSVQKIVDHPNYMPRIIQWMTDHLRNKDIVPAEYPMRFLEALNNPHKIWDKAFKKHISTSAQLLLYCMYFSKFESYTNPGINPEKLKLFYDRAFNKSKMAKAENLRESNFEETLREIKSSFIIVDGARINFINPSVLDFLSREIDDIQVLELLSSAVPKYDVAASLWETANKRFQSKPAFASKIAISLQNAIQSGEVSGRLPLDELASFVGGLLLASNNAEFIKFIRENGLVDAFWTNEIELFSLIEDLEEGRFRQLPHAAAYARLLRHQLYNYLTKREYVFELEELATLANSLTNSFVEFPDSFIESFRDAVSEAMDAIDPNDPSNREKWDNTLGEWLQNIEQIESYIPDCVDIWKKQEIEDIALGLEQAELAEMERHRDERALSRSSASGGNSEMNERHNQHGSQPQFSNDDLGTMFSSLKKS